MQRTLTADLAFQSGLEIVSFQYYDCLLFQRGETLKMFLPRSIPMLGGTAQDRLVTGDLLAIFEKDLERLRPPSKRFRFADLVTSTPIANFPSIITSSLIVEGVVDRDFFRQIHDLLSALPDRKSDWIAQFGEDFFARSRIDRCIDAIRYLNP